MMRLVIIISLLLGCFACHAQVSDTFNLMPVPADIKINKQSFIITQQFHVAITGHPNKRLYSEASRFMRRIGEKTGLFLDKQGFVTSSDNDINSPLLINVSHEAKLVLNEDESYHITINDKQVKVEAATDIGAIHALETLMQLVTADSGYYYLPGMIINDKPRFAWRGLLLDVALHFMPMDVIKRTLDGMCAVKLNVLHLHLCNDQGFRVESKVFPELQRKASDGKFFTQENIREIIAYADQRGIRVVPEFVVPAHTTAILTAYPQLASVKRTYTLQRYFGVFDPVLDPTNPKVYAFLDKLFTEMSSLFPDQYFHIGGDENTGRDWDSTPHIKAYMQAKKIKSYMDLQTDFNKHLLPVLQKNKKTMIGWDEILQPGIPKDVVIQSWRGKEAFYQSVRQGHAAILSNGYYIDLIQPADFHYLNDPLPADTILTPEQVKLVLGGAATMWSELVTPETVDSRIWPRTAAIAERLWSAREVNDVADMYRRLDVISRHLETLGLTHLSFRAPLLRHLANSDDIKALETLVDVIEPLKIYERNQGDTMYSVFSPYTKLADVATPDQSLPRSFGKLVSNYLQNQTPEMELAISKQLLLWKDNHQQLLAIAEHSPVLKEALPLSENLSLIAAAGLEAIEYIRQKNKANVYWLRERLLLIEKAKQQSGRCELQVVNPIEQLLRAAAVAEDTSEGKLALNKISFK